MNTAEKINRLTEMYSRLDVERMDLAAKREAILAPVAQALADLDAEISPRLDAISRAIQDLEAEVKLETIELGGTVRGTNLMCVFVQGRTTWDSKRLEGYATAHPEINAFKKTGEPTAQFRAIGK